MQDANSVSDRRGFGRKPSDIRGAVVVMGQPPKPFTMRDLSEGGALLYFDEPQFVPQRSFRITVDGTNLLLMCEVRHQVYGGAGVRFIKPAEGLALQRHFHLKPVDGMARPATALPRRPAPALRHTRGLELRAALDLVVPAETALATKAEAAGRVRVSATARLNVIRACAAAALLLRGGDLLLQAAPQPHAQADHVGMPKRS